MEDNTGIIACIICIVCLILFVVSWIIIDSVSNSYHDVSNSVKHHRERLDCICELRNMKYNYIFSGCEANDGSIHSLVIQDVEVIKK